MIEDKGINIEVKVGEIEPKVPSFEELRKENEEVFRKELIRFLNAVRKQLIEMFQTLDRGTPVIIPFDPELEEHAKETMSRYKEAGFNVTMRSDALIFKKPFTDFNLQK